MLKSRSPMPESRSPMLKSRSPIWNGNWPGARGIPPILPSPLPPRHGGPTAPPVLAAEEERAQTGRPARAHGTGTAAGGEPGSDRGGLAVAMQALRNRIATDPGGAADGRGCLLPSDCGLAGSDPARGHRIPVSQTGVSLLPEGDARRVAFEHV